jgi:hypothetical protein
LEHHFYRRGAPAIYGPSAFPIRSIRKTKQRHCIPEDALNVDGPITTSCPLWMMTIRHVGLFCSVLLCPQVRPCGDAGYARRRSSFSVVGHGRPRALSVNGSHVRSSATSSWPDVALLTFLPPHQRHFLRRKLCGS